MFSLSLKFEVWHLPLPIVHLHKPDCPCFIDFSACPCGLSFVDMCDMPVFFLETDFTISNHHRALHFLVRMARCIMRPLPKVYWAMTCQTGLLVSLATGNLKGYCHLFKKSGKEATIKNTPDSIFAMENIPLEILSPLSRCARLARYTMSVCN